MHLTEALALANAEGPRVQVAACLEALGILAMAEDQAVECVRLLRAASRLRSSISVMARPADQPEIDHAWATARARMGVNLISETWAEAECFRLP
jgi:lauroyl/myristoyl acyltransferase